GPGRRVGAEVVGEALRHGRDLRDRELHRSSLFATSVPEPAPSPGPGCVLAPICQRPLTGVRCPGRDGSGRQSRFWSSASEHEYGSPWWRLTLAACRSAGESTTRFRIAPSKLGACRAIRAWIRSAYRSRSSSVQAPSPV